MGSTKIMELGMGLFDETPESILSHHADAEAADAFIAWRKQLKKPLTVRAARMLAKTLAQINVDGGDATEALDVAQERGWQTIKKEWYFNDRDGNKSKGVGGVGFTSPNATAQQINDAARVRRSSLKDLF